MGGGRRYRVLGCPAKAKYSTKVPRAKPERAAEKGEAQEKIGMQILGIACKYNFLKFQVDFLLVFTFIHCKDLDATVFHKGDCAYAYADWTHTPRIQHHHQPVLLSQSCAYLLYSMQAQNRYQAPAQLLHVAFSWD